MSVKLSRVVLWDMEQQYQDTMTLTWLSTPEVGRIQEACRAICRKHNSAIAPPILLPYTFPIL